MNYFRTAMLLAGLTALFMGLGYLIGGAGGAMIALVIAAATNLFAYWNSDRAVLSMYGAHEVDRASAPDLVGLVAELAGRAGDGMRGADQSSEARLGLRLGRGRLRGSAALRRGLLSTDGEWGATLGLTWTLRSPGP